MDDLITRVLSGNASPFEAERLRHWRAQTPENERLFQDLTRVWSLTAPEPVPAASGPPDVEVILQRAAKHRGAGPRTGSGAFRSPPEKRRSPARRVRWTRWGLLAASAAALATVVRVLPPGAPTVLAEYEAPADASSTLTLRDGSLVRLGPGGRLVEVEAEGRREVSLEGRAFFAVAKEEERPFVVRTESGEIRVMGTRFQLWTDLDSAQTVVVEGRVRMSNGMGSVDVPAGSVGQMGAGSPPAARAVDDVYALLDWPGGILVFQGTPLEQVAREVSRFYGRPLRVVGPELNARRVTASFEGESFDEATGSLCLVTQAWCTVEGTGIAMRLHRDDEGSE